MHAQCKWFQKAGFHVYPTPFCTGYVNFVVVVFSLSIVLEGAHRINLSKKTVDVQHCIVLSASILLLFLSYPDFYDEWC